MIIAALDCRSNDNYMNSWVKEGEDDYDTNTPAPAPVQAAYKSRASGDSTYDDLKKMCDGMLATKDERWSLQTCLVCDPCCVHSCLTA